MIQTTEVNNIRSNLQRGFSWNHHTGSNHSSITQHHVKLKPYTVSTTRSKPWHCQVHTHARTHTHTHTHARTHTLVTPPTYPSSSQKSQTTPAAQRYHTSHTQTHAHTHTHCAYYG